MMMYDTQPSIRHAADALSPAKRALLDARLKGLTRQTPMARREHHGHAPPSFGQERLWYLERVGQGGPVYNIPAALRLDGALHVPALQRALGEIVRRHDALRTIFADRDGAPSQVIRPFARFVLPVDDLSALDDAAREVLVRRRAAEDAAQPFDLSAGPLFRATLLRLGERQHVLLLCVHHAVSDGWSMGVLFRELSALYGAYRLGDDSPLPELAIQYADYAAWQREHLQGERGNRQLAYWKAQLAGAPALLPLPTDRRRPAVQTYDAGHERIELSAQLLAQLQARAREAAGTLYMVLLAAFQVLLGRYSDSEDIVVGTPVAGRTRREVEGLIGFFVNTLTLRTDLAGNPTLRDVLQRVRAVTLDGYEHQDVPFEKLVAELQPERSRSHSPLFQVLFTLQQDEGGSADLPGLRVGPLGVATETTTFELSLLVALTGGRFIAALSYSTALFDRATIVRMLQHFARILEQFAANPEARLSDLMLLDATEQTLVLDTWNRTEAPYPADRCIHDLIDEQAAHTPDAIAVTFEDADITYRDLNQRANRLAHYLRRLGVGPETRVGVCLERGPEMMAALVAVLKAGGAYVPLDPAYPCERLAFMASDATISVLLTQRSLVDLGLTDGTRTMVLDDLGDALAAQPSREPRTTVAAQNAAYVIYTSGSTGKPKGVVVTHANVVAFFTGMDARIGRRIPGVWLALTRVGFDIHVLELLWTLARGFRVVVQPDTPAARGGDAIRRVISRHGVTHLQCTPSLAGLLIGESGVEAFSGLERLLLGGEALPSDLANRIEAALPGRLVNMYGPTETTVWSTTHALDGDRDDGTVAIGRPIANTRVYVVDGVLRPQPIGVPGELYIGGSGVTRGYLGGPALTAQRFVPDPFVSTPGARLYRTGDRVRWRASGTLEFLGRSDAQVKIRGVRIEPGEIEAALRQHPAVTDCAIVVHDTLGDTRLVAYVVGDVEADDLRTHLRRSLPDAMVPSTFVSLDRLPLTPNGKLHRAALPAPIDERRHVAAKPPRNFVEVQLMHIWEELLGLEVQDPMQSFFDLGGHSLLALRLLAIVNRRLRCDLPVSILVAGATLRQMADAILEQDDMAPAPPSTVVPLQSHGVLPPLFCVHPAARHVMGYLNVVRHLGANQPIFGLQDLGDDLSRPIAQIASEYVQGLRSVHPEGPYYLAGWSFGGFVAYEMASLLQRQGQRVAFLALLDTIEPVLSRGWIADSLDVLIGVARDIAHQSGCTLEIARGELEALTPDARFDRVLAALHASGAPAHVDAAALHEHYDVLRDRITSIHQYAPGPFSGTITLLRASVNEVDRDPFFAPWTELEKRTLGWSRISSSVEVHAVPGAHATIGKEPHVRELARQIRDALAAARARGIDHDPLPMVEAAH